MIRRHSDDFSVRSSHGLEEQTELKTHSTQNKFESFLRTFASFALLRRGSVYRSSRHFLQLRKFNLTQIEVIQ